LPSDWQTKPPLPVVVDVEVDIGVSGEVIVVLDGKVGLVTGELLPIKASIIVLIEILELCRE